jgi:hypothetical protein
VFKGGGVAASHSIEKRFETENPAAFYNLIYIRGAILSSE